MQKYVIDEKLNILQNQRSSINEKILYLITNNILDKNNITKNDVFNCYTGDGGLHGLEFSDFDNFHSFTEAKKEIEQGQFFTPHKLCKFLVDCIRPTEKDIIFDLTFGMGNFFNYLPIEQNIYGTEIDIKAVKVAKFLYPNANLSHEDIRAYQPSVRADIILGNPPFNLKWKINSIDISSQMYFCNKSFEVLKPAGLMAIIVPNSFLSDEFFNKSDIDNINSKFNFIVQFNLKDDEFKNLGVSQFATKIMIFQKKSQYVTDREYVIKKQSMLSADEIYVQYIEPALREKNRNASKIYFEGKHEDCIDKDFKFQVTKMLYDIKRHPRIKEKAGICESLLHQYLNQKKPEKMSVEEWDNEKIKSEQVIAYMQKILSSQNRIYRNEKRVVKTDFGFKLKDYSEEEKHEYVDSINNCILFKKNINGFDKLIERKRKNYQNQSMHFEEMTLNSHIKSFLGNWSVTSSLTGEIIKLTDVQSSDTNKLLQKRYGILQYMMGSGKTLCGIAMAQYNLEYTNIRNVFVVGTAIAINNTWDVVLKDYGLNYIKINTMEDINKIQPKQIVIITLNILTKLQKSIKQYIKIQSQKIMLIFDESDSISNPFSKRTKAMLSVFRKCHYKYLTTGTTTRNNICEISPQLELIYNNSINYLSLSSSLYENNKEGELCELYNDNYNKPIPAYRKGYELFSQSHLPKKITVFGIEQETQDVYNASVLKDLLDKTIITKSFEEVTGKKLYEIQQITVPFNDAEKNVYLKAIKEFEEMRRFYFSKQENSRKDSMLRMLQQLILLLKVCADPSEIIGYDSIEIPTKIQKTIDLVGKWNDERIAIGVRHISVVQSYKKYLHNAYPDRPIFIITGESTTFKKRRDIIDQLENTTNGILISTQQSLSASTNIDFVDKVLLPELHYNNASMSQYYFRFIRFTSKNWKQVYFLTYENTIEGNLLKMVLMKERLNLFMKNEDIENDELYERFGVDPTIITNLMSKEYDNEGKVYIRWGEQKIS